MGISHSKSPINLHVKTRPTPGSKRDNDQIIRPNVGQSRDSCSPTVITSDMLNNLILVGTPNFYISSTLHGLVVPSVTIDLDIGNPDIGALFTGPIDRF